MRACAIATTVDEGVASHGFGAVGLLVTLVVMGVLAAVVFAAVGGGTPTLPVLPTTPGATTVAGANRSGGSVGGVAGVISQAGDLVAQKNLGAALGLADQAVASGAAYGEMGAATFQGEARGLTFTSGPSSSASTVSVGTASGGTSFAVRSASGTCWLAWRSAVTWYGVSTSSATCDAAAVAGEPVAGGPEHWQHSAYPNP
jgi:hypothetical protein